MPKETKQDQLGRVVLAAKRLGALLPRNNAELALLAHLVGAVHSLRQAVELSGNGYSDEHALPDFNDRVLATAKAIGSLSGSVDPEWEAGYFFNSALMRIAAVNDRLGKYVGDRPDFTPEVRREVNRIKHDVDGIIGGREVTLEDALASIWKLAGAFAAAEKDLNNSGT